ncbi:rhodanese-like domain-containing protein [Rufibacter sp. LB8]|uniref:rhodanese-like domain-containing protein n=1 Tax=Rufibacter sp. LB8 TaxID=2777781 RepID=UPI00178C2A25|nr:rhodanese-like domain-containing protein [Rufibacter sp. LB8]
MNLRWLFLLPMFCWAHLSTARQASQGYALMLRGLYKNSVPVIQPSQLAAQLKTNPQNFVLLDVRTPKEYQVSHLTGARFLHYNKVSDKQLKALPKDKTMVVYCSVGYRSERLGEKLLALGYKNVVNLYGGLFQWVNEGLPVVNEKGPTAKVHAYSKTWGIWLTKGEKVYD